MKPEQKRMLLAALKDHGECLVRVEGTSMWPSIREGDAVQIRAAQGHPRIGSVAAFFNQDQLLVHRVVARRRQGNTWLVRVRGDAMRGSKAFIDWDRVIGTVSHIERAGSGRIRKAWVTLPLAYVAIPGGFVLRVLLYVRSLRT
jgi:hypothetical protein